MKSKINFTNIKKCKLKNWGIYLLVFYWIYVRIGNMNLIYTYKNINDVLYSLRSIKMDVLVFSHILRKHINHTSFLEIIKFQCILINSLSINSINFIEICNFCIENIKNTSLWNNLFFKTFILVERKEYILSFI